MLQLERRSSGAGSGACDAAGSGNGGDEDCGARENGLKKFNWVAGIEEGGSVEIRGQQV